VNNPEGNQKGVKSITVDGNTINGNIIPAKLGKHEVIVQM
jgi:cellobiose phosphorylase